MHWRDAANKWCRSIPGSAIIDAGMNVFWKNGANVGPVVTQDRLAAHTGLYGVPTFVVFLLDFVAEPNTVRLGQW